MVEPDAKALKIIVKPGQLSCANISQTPLKELLVGVEIGRP